MSEKNKKIISFAATVLIILAVLLLRSPLFHQEAGGQEAEITSLETEELAVTPMPEGSLSENEISSQESEKAKPPETAEEKASPKPEKTVSPTPSPEPEKTAETATANLKFRSKSLLNQHYEKHGIEMGFASAKEYEAAAAAVVVNPDALHKTEKEDGDDVYYVEETNEFVVVSKDGYLRTYFLPDSGKKYYDKQ